ncbi:unnamed protein product [Parnassius apollo]|uniref:Origin recognition complex subunit 1 n=1 Tax=Parnassius apollo TaxID=110799 RepID=A0A8S3XNW5_PARAO|nr:unnamed protein product [Parnassius apollo]
MRKRVTRSKPVVWLSKEIPNDKCFTTTFKHYEKFQFKKIVGEIGDYILISNADAAEPDTEEGCDAARIISLYEDPSNKNDPYRAKVQWYSRPSDLPNGCFNKIEPIAFFEREVVEDHRPFDTDVSIETFFKKCFITLAHTKESDNIIKDAPLYHYICRYRLIASGRKKGNIEPVLEDERKALQMFSTPKKSISTTMTPKTPNSLIKRMSRISVSESKSWNVSKNDGTKILLKRAILTDKNEKESPIKLTPNKSSKHEHGIVKTPKSSRKLNKNTIEELLSMELKENSDDELPTLIIKQHVPTTPKRKSQVKIVNETPKKVLLFEDEEKESIATRSGRAGRKSRHPVNYVEEEISPVKRTPRKKVIKNDSDDDFKPAPKTPMTPKTPKTPKTPRTYVAKTPKHSVTKRILTSELTPTLHSRAHSLDNKIQDYLNENQSLPGRESQMEEILSFVKNKLLDNMSGCMYISGVPGTGKTATVNSALKSLKDEVDLPDFQLVEVNGMRIAEPRQAYVQIYKQLTGKSVVWEQACTLLEKRFTTPGPRRTPTVLVVDELDALCTRRQDVLYSIMEWASHNSALLTVLAVANTMDLPERALAARVASRLGLTRLTFPPYTHTQLQCIVATRLAGANVTPDAVQLIARKVAAVSGDARRALALCARALELAGARAAGLKEVQQALGEAASSAAVRAIRNCSPAERLMLRAVAAEVERTGSDETTLSRALGTAAALVALDGRPYKSAVSIRAPTPSQAQAICARLAAVKLLLMEPKPAEPRLLLNVSVDDVHYATKQIAV